MAEQFVFSFFEPAKRKKPQYAIPRYKPGLTPNYAKVEVECAICGGYRLLSPSAVKAKNYCSKKCADEARKRPKKARIPKKIGRPISRWTEDQVEILVKNFPNLPTDELIARFFPWATRSSLHWKAGELGLKKTKAAKRLALGHVYEANGKRNRERAAPPIERRCPICGKTFTRKPGYGGKRSSGKQYCSRHCTNVAKTLVTGKDHKLYSRVEVLCQWCGEPFKVKKKHFESPDRGKFCSRSCLGGYCSLVQDGRRSSIEFAVEAELARREINFVPQKKMAQFVCDFYVPHLKLVIECDGDYWHSKPEVAARDKRKDAWLTSHGQKIVRLKEHEIKKDCAAAVDRALAA